MFENFKTDDPRLGDIIIPGAEGEVVLVGFPYDEGVRRNGGRVGARHGPSVAREMIKKVGAIVNQELDCDLRPTKTSTTLMKRSTMSISDSGDIDPSLALEAAHSELTHRVTSIIDNESVPFVIGGGNDQSYANAKGLLESSNKNGPVAVINIDAHLDVRPFKAGKCHSGSPFRQLLTDPSFRNHNGKFVEFAAQGSQCSAEHVQWLQEQGGKVVWLSELRKDTNTPVSKFGSLLDSLGDDIFVSFDLDAVKGADAPGVSCASPTGLTAQDAFDICFAAGKNYSVKLFDLSEFNPDIENYRTARLVALMFYHFCCGFCLR
ncbi:putative arginase [Paraphysoderma sedebokerense]|nr:putative arginase [Paraphysoderma sedebokerense]